MAIDPGASETGGLSRRQLLTRGAIAGGLVWAAPVIRTTAAYATTANGTELPCANFFMVVIKPDGSVHDAPEDLNSKYVPPAIRQWFADNPDVPVGFPAQGQRPLLTQTSQEVWAVLLAEVTGPNPSGRQCRMVIGWARKDHGFAEGYVDPSPPLAVEVGRRLLFPCPDPGNGDGNGNGNGNGNGGGGDDGSCKNGHDDGDHDADDVGCDPSATASAAGTTGVGTTDAATDTITTSPVASSSVDAGSIGSDGSSSGDSIGSDGGPSPTVSSDGSPSTGRGGGTPNPHDCIDGVFLIYCCPG